MTVLVRFQLIFLNIRSKVYFISRSFAEQAFLITQKNQLQQIGCELSKSRNHPESGMMHFQVIWQSAMEYGTKRISIEKTNYRKNGCKLFHPQI